MNYFFKGTLAYEYRGCPMVKEQSDQLMHNLGLVMNKTYENYFIDEIYKSQNASIYSDFKLPRTISKTKVYFQYFT